MSCGREHTRGRVRGAWRAWCACGAHVVWRACGVARVWRAGGARLERETHHVDAPASEQRRILVLVPVVTNEGTVTRVMLSGVGVTVTR